MSLAIHKNDLEHFVNELIKFGPVYGVAEQKEEVFSRFRFKKLSHGHELFTLYGPTVTPPKKYLFPPREEILKFEGTEIFPPNQHEFILITNKRDGEGLFYLDQIMKYPIEDTTYTEKRKKMFLIVIDAASPTNNVECDLYLQQVDKDHLLAFPFSSFGEKIIRGNKYFGHERGVGIIANRRVKDEIIFHPRLDEILENSRNHPIWDKLAEKCFNCGICSYVCPLCYCFETEDKVQITKETAKEMKGKREKRWDSCMLPDFAAVSFKNFRPETKDRIYNWYYHKFVRMPREVGFPGCIDCGRCTHFCPAKINFREVLKELVEDAKK
jgi:sulfhydrogenase subunit beta (sulfur reductase)